MNINGVIDFFCIFFFLSIVSLFAIRTGVEECAKLYKR